MKEGIPLKSVDCVLDSENGIIYPMLADGSTDLTDIGTSLLSVTDEWLDKLSEDDMWKIAEVKGPSLYKRLQSPKQK